MRFFAAASAALVLFGVGGAGVVTTAQRMGEAHEREVAREMAVSRTMKEVREMVAQIHAVPTLQEKLARIDHLFQDVSFQSRATEALTELIENGTTREKLEAVKLAAELVKVDFQRVDSQSGQKPLRGSENGRALFETLERQRDAERDARVRSALQAAYGTLKVLWDTPVPVQGRV